MTSTVKKITYSGMFLAIALLLPLLTGQIPEIGMALSPMHIPFCCADSSAELHMAL